VRTPYPFEPLWRAYFGPFTEAGQGLIPKAMKLVVEHLDVYLPGLVVRASPADGTVTMGEVSAISTQPGKLLWFRRMEMQIGTHDTNADGKAQAQFYGLGIENDSGRHYVRILADGKVLDGDYHD
jgi:hypothetical protein